MNFTQFKILCPIDLLYSKKVAYFSMEFTIHQPFKIYSGGLGYLSRSHLRSAYELRQTFEGQGYCGNTVIMIRLVIKIKLYKYSGMKKFIISSRILGLNFKKNTMKSYTNKIINLLIE